MTTAPDIRTHRPTTDPPAGEDWHHHAACRGAAPEQFFPLPGQDSAVARSYCERCTVRTECLQAALDGGDGGIRGGLTEDARRKLRRAQRSPA